jgi:hypothetical protein
LIDIDLDQQQASGFIMTMPPAILTTAFLLALLVVLAVPATAQNDLSKCQSIASPTLRLECYDSLKKPDNDNYVVMTLEDFKLDKENLKNSKVEIAGELHQMGELATLGSGLIDMSPVFIDIKTLPRDQRKAILGRCNPGCQAIVRGRVDVVFFTQTGLIAEYVHIH